jgi:hypothetical protein
MTTDSEKPDNRFNHQGLRSTRAPYSFRCGYATEPPSEIWPSWIQRSNGRLLLNMNVENRALLEALPGVQFERHPAIPFPWDNSMIFNAVQNSKHINEVENVLAANSIFPFIIYRPPLLVLLNSVAPGKKLFDSHYQSPLITTTNLIRAYRSVALVLSGSSHAHKDIVRIEEINRLHETAVRRHNLRLAELLDSTHEFRDLYQKMGGINEPVGENFELFSEYARYMVTYTLNYIKLLERYILYLLDRSTDPDNLRGMHLEFSLPQPDTPELAPFFEEQANYLAEDIPRLFKLKYELGSAVTPGLTLPEEPRFSIENTIQTLSVPALRLMLHFIYWKESNETE